MHIIAIEPGARLFFFAGPPQGDDGDGNDVWRQGKDFLELAHPLFARMHAEPARAQAQRVGAQQQISIAAEQSCNR